MRNSHSYTHTLIALMGEEIFYYRVSYPRMPMSHLSYEKLRYELKIILIFFKI